MEFSHHQLHWWNIQSTLHVLDNLIAVSHALCSVVKACVNIVNSTTSFDDPTPPTNIITNYTILNQYSIKQGIILFGKKGKASVQY